MDIGSILTWKEQLIVMEKGSIRVPFLIITRLVKWFLSCSFLQLEPYEVTLMGDVEERLTNVLAELEILPIPEPESVSIIHSLKDVE